jgi:hypothetical protein
MLMMSPWNSFLPFDYYLDEQRDQRPRAKATRSKKHKLARFSSNLFLLFPEFLFFKSLLRILWPLSTLFQPVEPQFRRSTLIGCSVTPELDLRSVHSQSKRLVSGQSRETHSKSSFTPFQSFPPHCQPRQELYLHFHV